MNTQVVRPALKLPAGSGLASPVDGPDTRIHMQPGVNIPQVRIGSLRAGEKTGGYLFLRVVLDEELEDLAQSVS